MVADAGPRLNPGIGNLNCPVEPFDTAGSQRIYHQCNIRTCLPDHPCQNLRCLHPCFCHDPGFNTTDPVNILLAECRFSVQFDNMPGDIEMVQHLRSQGICRHCPVAQSDHQNGFPILKLHQLLKFPCQTARNFPVISLILLRQCLRLHRHIRSDRFSELSGRIFCLHINLRHLNIASFITIFFHAYSLHFFSCMLQTLPGFQCQIRPHPTSFHTPSLFHTVMSLLSYFFLFFLIYVLTNPKLLSKLQEYVCIVLRVWLGQTSSNNNSDSIFNGGIRLWLISNPQRREFL